MPESFAATEAAKIMKCSLIAEYCHGVFQGDEFATDRVTNNRFHKDHLPARKYVTSPSSQHELAHPKLI